MGQLLQPERDALVFLGLMAYAYRNFDEQFKHPDNELSHHRGLNIFAAVIDNTDGEVLAIKQNNIHQYNNPLLHAEQRCLHAAIESIGVKRPRDEKTTSVENYYRSKLFNDPGSTDPVNAGCSIYTTLEPCPYCTSALLVSRMKRITFFIPDAVYGGSYLHLKPTYYAKYDMHYGKLSLSSGGGSSVMDTANEGYLELLATIHKLKTEQPKLPDTLLLDYMQEFLKACYTFFIDLQESSLVTVGEDRRKNYRTLLTMKNHLGID